MVINWRRDAGFWTFPFLPLIESSNNYIYKPTLCQCQTLWSWTVCTVHWRFSAWCLTHAALWIPSWCSLIRHWVNRSRVQQPDAAVCLWHFPLTFSVTLPWNSCCMAHTPLLWAKPVPLGPIFGRKLFFIAPKTLCLLPVWPRAPGASLRVVRPSFLLAVRGQL